MEINAILFFILSGLVSVLMEDMPFYIFEYLIYGMITIIVSPLIGVITIIIPTIGETTICLGSNKI